MAQQELGKPHELLRFPNGAFFHRKDKMEEMLTAYWQEQEASHVLAGKVMLSRPEVDKKIADASDSARTKIDFHENAEDSLSRVEESGRVASINEQLKSLDVFNPLIDKSKVKKAKEELEDQLAVERKTLRRVKANVKNTNDKLPDYLKDRDHDRL